MKADLIKIISELYSILDDMQDSDSNSRVQLESTIDELERMVLNLDE
jgi:hypothetical protein|tara:strand:- start:352 stop:492 length:141 start_codon:yes stop_codon:yes gene_type:complete